MIWRHRYPPGWKPPFGSVEISPNAPAGIVDWWLFNEAGGSPQNIAKPTHALTPNGAVGFIGGVSGLAVNLPGTSSDYYNAAESSDTDYIGDITLIWRGVVRDTSTFRHFMGKHAGNGATNCPFDFRTNGGTQLSLVRSSAITSAAYQSTLTFTANSLRTFAVTQVAGSNTAIFYIDGVADSAGSGSVTPSGSGADIRLGVRPDNAVIMNGYAETALIASQIWTATEIQAFTADPYAFLRPITKRRIFVPAQAAVATGWGPLLSEGRNRIVVAA